MSHLFYIKLLTILYLTLEDVYWGRKSVYVYSTLWRIKYHPTLLFADVVKIAKITKSTQDKTLFQQVITNLNEWCDKNVIFYEHPNNCCLQTNKRTNKLQR